MRNSEMPRSSAPQSASGYLAFDGCRKALTFFSSAIEVRNVLKGEGYGNTSTENCRKKAQGSLCRYSPWTAPFFDNLIRKIFQDPDKIVGPYVRPGMTVMDIGCGPGFFTLAMARMAGPEGRVIAVDMQQEMLDLVKKKSDRMGPLRSHPVPPVQAGFALCHEEGRVHPVLLRGARGPGPGCTVPGSQRAFGTRWKIPDR